MSQRCGACGAWIECRRCLHEPHTEPCKVMTGDASGDYDECGCTSKINTEYQKEATE
jgi:hypothetical protein